MSRRVATVLAVALVAVSAAAGGTAGAATAADGSVTTSYGGGTLQVSVDQSAFGDGVDDPANATVDVEVAGESVGSNVEPVGSQGGTNSYRVDLVGSAAADRSLADVNVTVTPQNGSASRTRMDLRYVKLGSNARPAGGAVTFPVAESVGVPSGATLQLDAWTGGTHETLQATMRQGGLRVSGSESLASVVYPGGGVTVGASSSADVANHTYEVLQRAGAPTASPSAAGLRVDSPLLFEGLSYTVRVSVPRDGATAVTTATTTADAGAFTVDTGVVSSEASVTVRYGDRALWQDVPVEGGSVSSAGLSDDGRQFTGLQSLDGEGTATLVVAAKNGTTIRTLPDVPYANQSLRLGEAGFEAANASYTLLVQRGGNALVATVDAGDAAPSLSPVAAGGGGGGGLVPDVGSTFGVSNWLIAGVVVALVVAVVLLLSFRGSGGTRSRSGGRGRSTRGTNLMDVDVSVLDEMTNEAIERPVNVEFEATESRDTFGGAETHQHKVRDGGTVQIPRNTYRAKIATGDEFTVTPDQSTLELRVPPRTESVDVHAANTDAPVPGADVTLTFPDGSRDGRTTGENGRVSFKVPRTVADHGCELSVEHDRYRPATTDLTDAVTLEPETGDVTVQARLDGDPVPHVDVVVEPADDYTRRVSNARTATTDERGDAAVDDLPVGDYEARLDFGDVATVETASSVSVASGGRESVTVDASFSFSLDDDQRAHIDDLHRDISDLTPSNRDGAIPYYFGSVLSAVLTAVDEFPDSGAAFVRHGVDPDEAADATIDAVAEAVEYTRNSMTNKQNVDLFSACRGLREARPKWSGEVTVADLVAFLGDDAANHRSEMIDRLEAVEDLLGTKQDEVSTVTPARDEFEQVREHATGVQDRSPVEQRAHFYVGLQLLDAVESVFDEPELVDRLEETVF